MNAKILDYGAGNVHSLIRAFASAAGVALQLESDVQACLDCDLLVLPGVGAFSSAAAVLSPHRAALKRALENGLPCIGICLGMQLLFEASEEGPGQGLSLIEGKVTRLKGARVPHMGWTRVSDTDAMMYFAHSYSGWPQTQARVRSLARFEDQDIVASVRVASTIGVQFHPEKSSAAGLRYLAACVREVMQ